MVGGIWTALLNLLGMGGGPVTEPAPEPTHPVLRWSAPSRPLAWAAPARSLTWSED